MKDQIRGKAEEIKGKATGDRKGELKGQARQKVGDVSGLFAISKVMSERQPASLGSHGRARIIASIMVPALIP